jgi:hypothetical protein
VTGTPLLAIKGKIVPSEEPSVATALEIQRFGNTFTFNSEQGSDKVVSNAAIFYRSFANFTRALPC